MPPSPTAHTCVSREDLRALAPGLVPFAGAVYIEAGRAPGRPGETRYGPMGSWVFAWLDLAALPPGLAARLRSHEEVEWVCIRAENDRSQLKNRAAALTAMEVRVVEALGHDD